VRLWQVQKLYERKLLPRPRRVGVLRVVPEGELPKVREALRKGGHLK
jgi:hypothetical protein